MSHSREGRSSASPPYSKSRVRDRRSRSLSGSRRSRSRSRDSVGAVNPGNNLYVTGLSTRVTNGELEKYFSREGKVTECQLVTDPHSKESHGFAFVTMETNEDAERCIKHLNRSVLEGRLITVEMAKRKRGRTPTPGRYQGLRDKREVLYSYIFHQHSSIQLQSSEDQSLKPLQNFSSPNPTRRFFQIKASKLQRIFNLDHHLLRKHWRRFRCSIRE